MNKKLLSLIIILFFHNIFAQNQSIDTLFTINKKMFRIQTTEKDTIDLVLDITVNSKVKLRKKIDRDGLRDIQFIDFNSDNHKDIMLIYSDNYNSLYLFNPKINNFSYIKGFEKFAAAIQLKSNTNTYYSYHKAGCADYNWISDLFVIQNFKTKHIGHIFANGCESETDLKFLKTYKILNNNEKTKKLIDNLNYYKSLPSFGIKWKFIEQYWNKNYKKFGKINSN